MAVLSQPHRRRLLDDLARTPDGLWVTCAGRSMEPTIRMGERVRVCVCERVHPGDVVLFAGARGLVLHRVVFSVLGTGWFLHIGDAGSGDGPGLARVSTVVGRADVPRRIPPASVYLAAFQRLGRAARRVLARA